MINVKDFFSFVTERENIRILKESGSPRPWTKDRAIAQNFYCNIFREDDKTTRWFRQNLRDPVKEDMIASLRVSIVFRFFNLIATGEIIKKSLLDGWDKATIFSLLQKERAYGRNLFNGAYIISSPLGDPKLEWVLKCSDAVLAQSEDIVFDGRHSLESFHTRLCAEMGFGPFMAYEIVTDLRHTAVLRNAHDIMTWASPGPGCARGLGWVVYNDNEMFHYGGRADMQEMLFAMRELLSYSQNPELWPWPTRRWEMREVEHALCEYDKYRRVQAGGRAKRKYPGGLSR